VARTAVSSANVAMVVVGEVRRSAVTGGTVVALGRFPGEYQRGLETGSGA
jgi:hypothetical protein